jgi:hypothetical protein
VIHQHHLRDAVAEDGNMQCTMLLASTRRCPTAVFADVPTPRLNTMSLRDRAKLANALADEAAARKAAAAAWELRDQATASMLLRLWGDDDAAPHKHLRAHHLPGSTGVPRHRGNPRQPGSPLTHSPSGSEELSPKPQNLLSFSAFLAMLAGVLALQVR